MMNVQPSSHPSIAGTCISLSVGSAFIGTIALAASVATVIFLKMSHPHLMSAGYFSFGLSGILFSASFVSFLAGKSSCVKNISFKKGSKKILRLVDA